jgi:hypothetical protein
MPIWFFLWVLSGELIHSKYEYLIPIIWGIGLLLGVIGMFGAPFLESKITEDDVKATVDKVKDWEPVIKGQLSVRGKTLDMVYDKTLEWLESIGADILKQDSPNYVVAFHEIYDSNFKGVGIPVRIESWEKFFEISLAEVEGYVRIIMNIHQGVGVRTSFDRFKNRRRSWPQFVEDFSSFSGSIIESFDGAPQITNYESRISDWYMFLGSPFGIYLSLFGVVLIAVLIWGPAVINPNNILIFLGLVFIFGLFAFYRAVKSR